MIMESYSITTLRVDFNSYMATLAREYDVYYRTRHDAYNKTEKYEFSIEPNPWCTIASITLDYDNAVNIFNKVYEARKRLEKEIQEAKARKLRSATTIIGSKSELMSIDTDALYATYAINDARITAELTETAKMKMILNKTYGGWGRKPTKLPNIENVIYNNPATIILWGDHTKTVVKAQDGEPYDPEKGLAMAICKKALGNEGNYYEKLKPWLMDVTYEIEPKKHGICSNVANAYRTLKYGLVKNKITKADLIETIEEAADYLEEELNI